MENNNEQENTKLNTRDILRLISNALKVGTISSRQAAEMRSEVGVYGSRFCKKSLTKAERKSKRKAQKKARAVTTRRGYKGQKLSKG